MPRLKGGPGAWTGFCEWAASQCRVPSTQASSAPVLERRPPIRCRGSHDNRAKEASSMLRHVPEKKKIRRSSRHITYGSYMYVRFNMQNGQTG